MGYYYT